jgi:hypothetical protein
MHLDAHALARRRRDLLGGRNAPGLPGHELMRPRPHQDRARARPGEQYLAVERDLGARVMTDHLDMAELLLEQRAHPPACSNLLCPSAAGPWRMARSRLRYASMG